MNLCTREDNAAMFEFRECASCDAKPGSPALCEACLHNRKLVTDLNRRIKELEEGECRFHCRMRKDMWKAGGRYVWEHWNKLGRPAGVHLDQMYKEWRKRK